MYTHAGFTFTVERKEYPTLFMLIVTPVLQAGQALQWKILSIFLRFSFNSLLDSSLFHKALYATY